MLDERSLQIMSTYAPDDGSEALKILRQYYASTEKKSRGYSRSQNEFESEVLRK